MNLQRLCVSLMSFMLLNIVGCVSGIDTQSNQGGSGGTAGSSTDTTTSNDGGTGDGTDDCKDDADCSGSVCLNGTCQDPACGDGVVSSDKEECDDGDGLNTNACLNTCKLAACGDGFTEVGVEQCDDGPNNSNTAVCTKQCKLAKCGDGLLHAGVEQCDDGDGSNSNSCTNACKNASCGDGLIWVGVEECDDGNFNNADSCSTSCKLVGATCGNGVLEPGEQCDDGNPSNQDSCLVTCQKASCGDGFVHANVESCDDNNGVSSDGCENDCTLTPPGTTLMATWAVPDLGYSNAPGVTTDSTGNIIMVATFFGTIGIDGKDISTTVAGSYDGIVVKYDPQGNVLCLRQIGGPQDQEMTAVAVDGDDNLLVGGHFKGSIDLGFGQLPQSAGDYDIFILKLDGATCLPVWIKMTGDASYQHLSGIAVDPTGNVWVTGRFSGSFTLGDQVTSAGDHDAFLLKLKSDGTPLFAKRFGNENTQRASDIAADLAGNVVIGGIFDDQIDLGCGAETGSLGNFDGFVAKFDSQGNCQWSKSFGDNANQGMRKVGVDDAGNVYLTGAFVGTVDFGDGPLMSPLPQTPNPNAQIEHDAYLAIFDPDGNPIRSNKIVNLGGEYFNLGMTINKSGKVALSGYFQKGVDFTSFGGDTLTPLGNKTAFVVEIDANGNYLFGKAFGGTPGGNSTAAFSATAFDSKGNIIVGGMFDGKFFHTPSELPVWSADRNLILLKLQGTGP